MFDASQKSTGTGYTTTATFLIAAFIISPAALFFSRPLGFVSVSLSVACSVLCIAFAWFIWRKYSQLSMPSISIKRQVNK